MESSPAFCRIDEIGYFCVCPERIPHLGMVRRWIWIILEIMETIVFIIIAFASVMAAVAIFMASRVVRLEKEKSALETRLQAGGQYAEDLKRSHEEAMQRSAEQYRRDVELLKEQFRETMQRSAEQHQKEMEMMKDQFRVAAAEISEKNSREFKEQSAGRIEDILKPIKEKFSEFTKSMDDSRTSAVKMKTSLEEQIKNLMDQSGKVSDEARNLTNALTSRSKVQGDFGELILKDILVNAGLTEGLHFICQGVMTDRDGHEVKSSDGRTLIPDVLVLYPDDTLVVVDSKVSLTAYTAYCAAEAEDARDAAARQHVDSVRKHINELADKGYASYIPEGKRKVDYNIMFIPNEGAFQLMLEKAPALWQEAKDRKVLVVSQMTLVIVLNMIQMVWKQAERERNIEEVHRAASELMSQLGNWLDSYVKLGEHLERTSAAYRESKRILTDSQQSVVKKIRKLESLGVEPKTLKAKVKGGTRRLGTESVVPAELSDAD